MCTAKNATSKNHPKAILRDKNHLYGIVLVNFTSNVVFKARKHFRRLVIAFFLNC